MALDRDLIARVRALGGHDLRRLVMLAEGLVTSREGAEPRRPAKPSRVTYRQESVRCGRPTCTRCPHGPYWYAYWREGGRLRSRYVGKDLPPSVGVRR